MTINQAREQFIRLMQEIERELGANIIDVSLWKTEETAHWGGQASIKKDSYHASITFGDAHRSK
jgi:hypothetical protein